MLIATMIDSALWKENDTNYHGWVLEQRDYQAAITIGARNYDAHVHMINIQSTSKSREYSPPFLPRQNLSYPPAFASPLGKELIFSIAPEPA